MDGTSGLDEGPGWVRAMPEKVGTIFPMTTKDALGVHVITPGVVIYRRLTPGAMM